MGTPAPPNTPGNVCNLCFGTSEIFAGNTPKFMTLEISGIQAGQTSSGLVGDLPNGRFRLEQVGFCSWRLRGQDHIYTLLWTATRTVVTVQDASTLFPFQTPFVTGRCLLEVPNTFQVWNGNSGFKGVANISWETDGL